MKDGFFSRKVYQGLYTPVYRFAEFGDVSNYWIELSYLCNRDDWQSLKGSLGSPLDFDLLNEDGDKIFGEVEAEHLAELKSFTFTRLTVSIFDTIVMLSRYGGSMIQTMQLKLQS